MPAEVGGGRVSIELDGKTAYLEPSLEACIEISKIAGGLGGAIERCRQFHFETICAIIGLGVRFDGRPINPAQRDRLVPKAVYEAGVIAVAATCIEFLTIVMNGGRELADEDDEGGEGEEDGPLGKS